MNIVWMVPGSEPRRFGAGGKTRILLDDAYTYSARVKFTQGELVNRDTVKEKASEKIPENLDNLIWDYVGDSGFVQVIALVKSFSDELKNQKLKIEAIEPVSYSLARFIGNPEPTIIIYNSDRSLLVAVEKNKVVSVKTFEQKIEEKDIRDFVNYTKDIFANNLSKIIISGNLGFEFKEENVVVENKILNPVESLKRKTDFKKTDNQSLILIVNGVHKFNILKFILLPIIFLGFLILGFFIFKNYKNIFPSKKTVVPTAIPTQVVTVIPTQIEEKKIYQISVLNGSGITGEARKVADSLIALGLEVGNVGNADNSDYQETIIRHKENVESSFIDTIDTELKKNYTVNREAVNNNTEQSDVIVIIGKLKNE